MPRRNKTPEFQTLKAYEAFLRSVRLIAMGMNTSRAELDRAEYIRLRREKGGGRLKFNATYKLDDAGDEYFEATGNLELTVEDPKNQNVVLRVQLEIGSHFHAKKAVDKKNAEAFVQSDLKLIFWPFFRQWVFDVTGRMAISPITVPLSTDVNQ